MIPSSELNSSASLENMPKFIVGLKKWIWDDADYSPLVKSALVYIPALITVLAILTYWFINLFF